MILLVFKAWKTFTYLATLWLLCMCICKLTGSDCSTHECPNGSQCKLCSETGLPCCEYSCAVDNGGCGEGRLCTTVDVPSCNDGEGCSPDNITCEGN